MLERHAVRANVGAVRQTVCDRQHASAGSFNLVVNSSFAKFAAIGSMLPLADDPVQQPVAETDRLLCKTILAQRDAGHISASWGDMITMMVAPCVPKEPVIKWPRTPPNHTCVRGHAVGVREVP